MSNLEPDAQVAANRERNRRHRYAHLVATAKAGARALPGTDRTTDRERPAIVRRSIRAWLAGETAELPPPATTPPPTAD